MGRDVQQRRTRRHRRHERRGRQGGVLTALSPLTARSLPALPAELDSYGEVFATFTEQDSGCVAYGEAEPGGARWLVEAAPTARAAASMERAAALHASVRHEVIVPQVHRFTAGGLPAVVIASWPPRSSGAAR